MRLKLDSIEQDELRRLGEQLRKTGHIQSFGLNMATKTLLIKAQNDEKLREVLAKAEQEGLFKLSEAKGSERNSLTLEELRLGLDRLFRSLSDNRLNLRSGMATVLVGLGLRQLALGNFTPAGLTLVFYAMGMMEMGKAERNR